MNTRGVFSQCDIVVLTTYRWRCFACRGRCACTVCQRRSSQKAITTTAAEAVIETRQRPGRRLRHRSSHAPSTQRDDCEPPYRIIRSPRSVTAVFAPTPLLPPPMHWVASPLSAAMDGSSPPNGHAVYSNEPLLPYWPVQYWSISSVTTVPVAASVSVPPPVHNSSSLSPPSLQLLANVSEVVS